MFLLLTAIQVVLACSCAPVRDFKSQEDLKGYSFIALVTIKKLPPINTANKFMRLRQSADIVIEPIELFKGEFTTTLYDASFNSNCALSLQEGEQWILFGYGNKGRTEVSRCTYSVRYRDTLGGRDWKYFTGIKQLDVLKTIYEQTKSYNIADKQFYKNGKPELIQHTKKGILNGWRIVYYPNGRVYLKEKFKNGIRVGRKSFYSENGQLMESIEYKNGFTAKETRYQDTTEIAWYLNFKATHLNDLLFDDKQHNAKYYNRLLDSLRKLKKWDKQLAYQKRYSKDGFSYAYEMYNYKGDLEVKNYLDWNKQLSEHTLYYDTGKPKMYIRQDQKINEEIEYDYAEDGKRREFVKKCESCKYFFDKANPAGTPEKVYIQ
jgi:antitoxin component YwqK of YwqJK toxin-antitoxin module